MFHYNNYFIFRINGKSVQTKKIDYGLRDAYFRIKSYRLPMYQILEAHECDRLS